MTVSRPSFSRPYGGNPAVARPAAVVAGKGGVRLESGLTLGREDGHRTIAQAGGADPGP